MKLAQKSPAAPDAGHPQERRAFLYVFLLAVVLTLVVELFNHKAFTSGAILMASGRVPKTSMTVFMAGVARKGRVIS